MQITPVILAGGGGARLWPLSQPDRPKPLLKLLGERSLLQETALRFAGDDRFGRPILSVGQDFAAACLADMRTVDAPPALTVIEPVGRDTAAAIAAAALSAPDDALLLMAPADHAIAEPGAFRDAVALAAGEITSGLAVFGVTPDRPETGYGYINPAAGSAAGALRQVERFTEKPDPAGATALLKAGALWNAGLFLGQRRSFIAAFEAYAPDILAAVRAAMPRTAPNNKVRLEAKSFSNARPAPFDKAIMERTDQAHVAALDVGWSDVGDWNAVWQASGKDSDGNVIIGEVRAVDCQGCYLRGEGAVAKAAGLRDMVVVATPSGMLTLPRAEAQSVKRLVGGL